MSETTAPESAPEMDASILAVEATDNPVMVRVKLMPKSDPGGPVMVVTVRASSLVHAVMGAAPLEDHWPPPPARPPALPNPTVGLPEPPADKSWITFETPKPSRLHLHRDLHWRQEGVWALYQCRCGSRRVRRINHRLMSPVPRGWPRPTDGHGRSVNDSGWQQDGDAR